MTAFLVVATVVAVLALIGVAGALSTIGHHLGRIALATERRADRDGRLIPISGRGQG